MILACFVLGLSTCKVGEALLSVLGRPVSASAVSQVAKSLDAVVAAFHRRALANRYRVLSPAPPALVRNPCRSYGRLARSLPLSYIEVDPLNLHDHLPSEQVMRNKSVSRYSCISKRTITLLN
jgi:hypothetical protein